MNLTKTSEVARKAVVASIAIILFFIATKSFLIPMGKKVIVTVFPPRDLPNPIYGKLAAPIFKQKEFIGTNVTYELDTKNGKLPTGLPNKMAVYKIENPVFSYEGGKLASETARYLGFLDTDLISGFKQDTYVWKNNTLGRQLEIQINTKTLYLDTDKSDKAGYYNTIRNFDRNESINEAKRILKSINRELGTLYEEGSQKLRFGKYSGKKVIDTTIPENSQMIMIDFYRSINKIPIYGPDPDKGLVHIVIGNTNTPSLKVLEAEIKNYEINTQSNATYPIVPVTQVWDAIKQNKGVVASINPQEQSDFDEYVPARVSSVLISEIELAYYESDEEQKFLQPVYVFKGYYTSSGSKGSIVLFYPAITSEYIIQETSTDM